MAWESFITRRNTIIVCFAALGASYFVRQNRLSQQERGNRDTFHVKPERSGGGI